MLQTNKIFKYFVLELVFASEGYVDNINSFEDYVSEPISNRVQPLLTTRNRGLPRLIGGNQMSPQNPQLPGNKTWGNKISKLIFHSQKFRQHRKKKESSKYSKVTDSEIDDIPFWTGQGL